MARLIKIDAYNDDNTKWESVTVHPKEGIDQFEVAEGIAKRLDDQGKYVEVEVTYM